MPKAGVLVDPGVEADAPNPVNAGVVGVLAAPNPPNKGPPLVAPLALLFVLLDPKLNTGVDSLGLLALPNWLLLLLELVFELKLNAVVQKIGG